MPRQRNKKKKFDQHLQHLAQAQLERGYYNENTRLARRDRKLVEENWIQKQGKVGYKSVDAIAHCSFDWSQNPSIPYSSQQASQLYFLTALKVYLFGVQNEATNEQLNFVLAEDELLNKGINGTLSMVLAGIKYFNRGEKHLKLTCDNCVGQNKNNATIRFCQFLVMAGYYETVELNFMIAGHTKFSPDRNYGMTKKLYWKSTVYTKEQFEEVVKKSSFLNKVQCYENGQGFQYFDFKEAFEKFFKKLPNINKYHHFLIESSNLGVVKVQEFANGDFIEIDLWKDKGRIIENIREIKNLAFHVLKPKPLSLERQQYLYKKIRPLLPEKYWNTLPLPSLQC